MALEKENQEIAVFKQTIENDSKNEDIKEKHNLDYIIESFLHRTLDIEECAKYFIHKAYTSNKEKYHNLLQEITHNQNSLDCEVDTNIRLLTMKSLRKKHS